MRDHRCVSVSRDALRCYGHSQRVEGLSGNRGIEIGARECSAYDALGSYPLQFAEKRVYSDAVRVERMACKEDSKGRWET